MNRPRTKFPEEWRWVIGYEGLYEVSSFGRIRTYYAGGTAGLSLKAKYKRQTPDQDGYLRVGLYGKSQNKKSTCIGVHRLVLEAFIGPCPEGCEASHLDGNHKHNSLKNLCWETHLENNRRREEHGTLPKGKKHPHFGKPMKEEIKKKLSLAHKGRHEGSANNFFGRKHSEESLDKMRKAHRLYWNNKIK